MTSITRRQLLSASAVTALGIPLVEPLGQHVSRSPRAVSAIPAAPSATTTLEPLPPYLLTHDSTLSEDYFLSSEVVETPDATVYPVIRSDGSQAAILVSGADGTSATLVSHDPSGASQTGYVHVTVGMYAGAGGIFGAAAGPGQTIYVGSMNNNNVYISHVNPQGQVTPEDIVTMPTDYYAVEATFITDTAGRVRALVYATSTKGPSSSRLVLFDPVTKETTDLPIAPISPEFQGGFENMTFAAGPPSGGAVCGVVASQTLALGLVYGRTSVQVTTIRGISSATVLAPPILTPNPPHPEQVAAVLYSDGTNAQVIVCDANGNVIGSPLALLSAPGLTPGTLGDAAWFQDATGLITCYVLAGEVLYLQTIDLTAPTPVSTPIPIEQNVNALYLPERGLTADTALLIAKDSVSVVGDWALSSLSRRTTGAWVSTPIQMDSPTTYQVDTYRTMLTVTDSTGAPVRDYPISVTSTLDALAFQPTGAKPLPAGVAVSLTTDSWGQLCLATPATALYASSLAVSWGSGHGTTDTVTVNPDAELHGFLAGGATGLNSYSSVTDALTQNSGAGKALTNLSASSADDVAKAITAAMKAGQAPTNPGASTPFTLTGLDTSTPTHKSSVDHSLLVGDSDWWDRVKHDVESVWTAIERGIAKVSSMISEFDTALGQWTVSLVIAIDKYVTAKITYAIKDLRSAVVAIHGIFQALGADIVAAIKFLRTLVSEIMKDASVIAELLYGWLVLNPAKPDEGLGRALTELKSAKATVNADLAKAEKQLVAGITNMFAEVGKSTTSTAMKSDTSGRSTSARSSVKSSYLHEKTRSTSVPDRPPSQSSVAAASAIGDQVANHSATGSLHSSIKSKLPVTADPHDALDLTLGVIGDVLVALVDDLITVAKDVLDGLLDILVDLVTAISDALSESLDDLPLIGGLLKALGVSTDLTLGRLICYVVGFGAAALGDLFFGGRPWLPQTLSSPRTSHREGTLQTTDVDVWGVVLDLVTATVNGLLIEPTWVSDAARLTKAPVPAIVSRYGVALEVLLQLISFPFATTKSGELAWEPRGLPSGGSDLMYPVAVWSVLGFIPALGDWLATVEGAGRWATAGAPILDSLVGSVILVENALDEAGINPAGAERTFGILGAVFGSASNALKLVGAFEPPFPLISFVIDIGMLGTNIVLELVDLDYA